MGTPLTDRINALTAYANGITGNDDATLSDAVYSLAEGYRNELYPIWYDITNYVGRPNDVVDFHHGTLSKTDGTVTINDEDTSLLGTFETLIPVNPDYEYAKSQDGRMYALCYYDENKQFISTETANLNNLKYTVLPQFPQNCRFIRFATYSLTNNWRIKIIRIA